MAATEVPLGASLPASFREMREAGELVDVHLIFGQTRVACHRVVLAGTCEYFRSMFLSNMSESDANEINMEGINASTGLLLVQHLYSADIELNCNNAQDLLSASSMLLLNELTMKIGEFLTEEIDIANCVDLLNLSRHYDLATLGQQCLLFWGSHINEITTEEVLTELQEVDLVDLLYTAKSHEAGLHLLQRWTSSTEDRRRSFQRLKKHIKHDSFIVGDRDGRLFFCDNDQQWKKIKTPPTPVSFYSACASPGGFILTGGEQDDIVQRNCYAYDVHDKQWKTLPPMPTARCQHSSVCHNRALYVVGGYDGGSAMNSVEKFDLGSQLWSPLPPLPNALHDTFTVFASNSLFVLGGWNHISTVDVHEYSSSQKAWCPRNPMPERSDEAAAECFNDHIYVVGGFEQRCMRYNPRYDTWVSLQQPRFAHFFGRALVWQEKVLLCGGNNDDSIEEYSPLTDQWFTWTLKLPTNGYLKLVMRI